MIADTHMKLLQEELEALRARLSAGQASISDVRALHQMAARMLADGRGGGYESALAQIHDLLDVVARTMHSQARLRRIARGRPSA